MSADEVLAACESQARYCERLGSPFTARVCRLLALEVLPATPLGRELLLWPGDPSPEADNLPLRLAGALHFLARAGRAGLIEHYPPVEANERHLGMALRSAFETESDIIREFASHAPQTNEVGRSAVLCAGLLVVAARFGLPIVLYEIGSSAGLNLMLDRYRYQFGEVRWGDPAAALRLAPDWEGPPPPVDAPLKIASRAGVDMAPIDVTQPEQSARLLAYVWADQAARLARLTTALQMAVTRPPIITADDAAVWLPRRLRLAARGQRGKVRVLMHSLVWGYLTAEVKDRIERHMNACALRATYDAPLAWLSFEIEPEQRWVVLRLRIWPDGSNTVLAHARAHGDAVKWLLA